MGIKKHIAANNTDALALATELLDAGRSVAVVSEKISPFAMLVNEHGDRLTTLEANPADLLPGLEELKQYDLSSLAVDNVIIVSAAHAGAHAQPSAVEHAG